MYTQNNKYLAFLKKEQSNIWFVSSGDPEKRTEPLGAALGITIPLICLLVLVIILLLRREHKRNCELKKKKACLWAENNPLTPVPEVNDPEADHSWSKPVYHSNSINHTGLWHTQRTVTEGYLF